MTATTTAPPSGVAGRLATLVEGAVGRLPVRLRAWDGSESGPPDGPVLVVRDRRALRRLLWSPNELGLAQAYIAGEIDVEGDLDLALRRARAGATGPVAIRLGGRLRALREVASLGALGLRPPAPPARARLAGRMHTRGRDRAAISYHYDLSNDFYELLLDPTMTYSCAFWTSDAPGYGLAQAQNDKLDLICRKLGLTAGMRMLDVGCGWGSLTVHAAKHFGVRVTGVTLSAQQRAYATARIAADGLADLAEVRLQDYRDVIDGPYDAIATVEMGEHVGADRYPAFAAGLHGLLAPQGRLLVQQMSRGHHRPGGGDFIESYVAPDMHMRPVGETVALLESAGFEVRDVHGLREHYVRTVDAWLAVLERRWDAVVELVGEPMARVWRLYLVGGALAFEQGRMGVDQILAVRPGMNGVSGLPPTRGAWT
jgi:cyclopropane-fatty-acyl-phospholipid synthase